MAIAKKQTLVVGFAISGELCYLSHRESVALFQRVLVRSGVDLYYSQGFNPRIKLSLPFPRPVGVCSDQELLCVRLGNEVGEFSCEEFSSVFCSLLPAGCVINRVEVVQGNVSFRPGSVRYVLSLNEGADEEAIKASVDSLVEKLSGGEPVSVERSKAKRHQTMRRDISGYIESVEMKCGEIFIVCGVSPAGSARVDELLQVLGLDYSKLSRPIQRDRVQWNRN